eukprot:Seg2630.2 transcript_id=Seg2630.2/GoldUCD/mRNA.D3Y31 product="Tyrosine-protein phosphatase Lar" protein_id=Seg2630.2/GoldUCD/D3Y31
MLHRASYVTVCSTSPKGGPLTYPDIYFKNKVIVSDSNHIVTRDSSASKVSITMEVKVMYTADFGVYTCKEPGTSFSIKQAVLSEMSITVPSSDCLMAIGMNATADTGIHGIPIPGCHSYVVWKQEANRKMKLIAQMNPFSGVMEVGAGKYYINPTTGQFSINTVRQSDSGEYRLTVVAKFTFVEQRIGKIFQIRAGNRPNITTPPFKSYDLVSGVPALLRCEFKDPSSLYSYLWVQKTANVSVTISNASIGALTLRGTNLRIVPTVANLGETFTCVGENKFGKGEAMTTISMVYVKPVTKLVTKLIGDKNKMIVLGRTAVVSCRASGYPTPVVTWLKWWADGTFRNVSGQVTSDMQSVIKINSTQLIEEGLMVYKCVAVIVKKPELRDETNMTVTVLRPPRFDKEASTSVQQYPTGKALTQSLVCIASGPPRPAIKFMKGSLELKGAVLNPSGSTMNATLHYMANITEDSGKISCVARNGIGTTRHEIDVVVVLRPAQPRWLTVIEVGSTSIQLVWGLVSGAANYKVYRNDSMVLLVASNRVKVRNLQKGATYTFYTTASNIAGDSPKSLEIQVTTLLYDKPGIIRFNRDGPPKMFWTTDITLTWLKPVQVSDGPSIMYEVKYCPKFNSTYPVPPCNVVLTNKTRITLKGLKERTVYLFTIRAKSKGRTGDEFTFEAITGLNEDQPKARPFRIEIGPRGGALVGFVVVAILVWCFVIDVVCCLSMDRGLISYCYKKCCVCLGKERLNENADFIELRDYNEDKL